MYIDGKISRICPVKGGLISEDFGPIVNKICMPNLSPEQKISISCLLKRAGNWNFLFKGKIWHLLMAMLPNSKYLLSNGHGRISCFFQSLLSSVDMKNKTISEQKFLGIVVAL